MKGNCEKLSVIAGICMQQDAPYMLCHQGRPLIDHFSCSLLLQSSGLGLIMGTEACVASFSIIDLLSSLFDMFCC